MSTSGQYSFAPNLGQIVLYSYNLVGLRQSGLVQEHFEAARMAANLVCADFSNKGVNLWQVDLVSIPLVEGVATYSVDPSVVVILDGYIRTTYGSVSTDRYILPVSRSEYASYANKEQQGFPTTYWNDRLLAPTVTLWPVPNGQQDAFEIYVLRQIMDANYTSGQNVDVPYLWLKAFAYALAEELAAIWAPDKLSYLSPISARAYAAAADTNTEISQFYISPNTAGYYS